MALLTLLPSTLGERNPPGLAPGTLGELLLKGLCPPVDDRACDPPTWYGNYVETYLEWDVRQRGNVRVPATSE